MDKHVKQIDLGDHYVRTVTQGANTLVVCFEGVGSGGVLRPDAPVHAWGQGMLSNAGFDSIHALPKKMDWYQNQQLQEYFKEMQEAGFFAAYRRVVTYGASMGGFAALAFAKTVGAHSVISLQPRTTLRDDQARWDSAFSKNIKIKRKGPFADAINGLDDRSEVLIFYDPLFKRDCIHAKRIEDLHDKTCLVRVPLVGHNVPYFLVQMGILKQTIISAIEGNFDPVWFYQQIRNRRDYEPYKGVFAKTLERRRLRRPFGLSRGKT